MRPAEPLEAPPGSPPTSPRGSDRPRDVHASVPDGADPREWHYGEFFGLRPLPPDDGRPLLVVHGNCQAESLRVLLDGAGGVRSVRMPPVHELDAADLPHMRRVLQAADVLVSQPVREGYRELPLGTAQLTAAMRERVRVVRFPVIRWAGLFPHQVIVRVAGLGDPPVVPYHDLRTLVEASTGVAPRRSAGAQQVLAVGAQSVAQLEARERDHDTVVVSDLLIPAGAGAAHTVNHPGNPVLRGLAQRVQERLGVPADVPDPWRTLLDSIHAPLGVEVLEAWGLTGGGDAATPREDWLVHGVPVPDEDVRQGQLTWYREHPDAVTAGLRRHVVALQLLGLA